MKANGQRVTKLAGALLVAAALICVPVALWLEYRKHAQSGVPWGHFAASADGRKFHVPRGGGPVEGRPQAPMTEEQYRHWQEDQFRAWGWALAGALSWVAGLAVLRLTRRSRRQPTSPPPNQPLQPTGPAARRSPG
jgi:hypothetical protein